ncbi:GNAT family N-acetyltransferase [Microbacterium sp. ASV49]|uniref:GNAT family N-acetyltransferase n=1 Tax=Microbacterium candidum TaxID=3041922 RepID=A0ABT7N3W4_9MICO|nr:GNAT family N-acetyltransferase [Microbacterium sp. ASV49]MDL9981361.1 GNAT family N-acetyltransferase [Microbacterium sp. ASV49]
MPRIRTFRPGDEEALADICVRTGDAGGDATGRYSSDDLLPAIFVLPYVARHPDFAWVVESDDDRVTGYIVGAPDTDAFDAWFRDEWWPRYHAQFPRPAEVVTEEDDIVTGAYRRAETPSTAGEKGYPAHLHIDLLPELQGQGFGRRLIETLMERFRDAAVPGVHLIASARNTGAAAFYPRVGFTLVPSVPGILVYVRKP